ncbi:MAG TPA: MarR family transcriptional regulator [Kiritimatiellia bacterium]|nr:MarR family transcriptional regulator [Kiritimatiellia bacterium]
MTTKEDISGAHVWLVLWKAWEALKTRDLQSIEALGVCFSDFAVLEILLHKGPLPVNTIGRKVRLTSGSITTAVNRLEKKRFVERKSSVQDGRVAMVHLTPKGHAFIEQSFAQHAKRLDEMVSVLAPSERKTLVQLLRKLGKSVQAGQPG